ncbi:MAG: hypothetical protein F6J93_00610 [Oscillatoria sp. SIO1A7]|nr:hypothetical protein [Oscillatoria sp. SIO1A7]
MDLLKNEISALVYKVDALYETIDQLNSKIAMLLSERGLAKNEIVESSGYQWRRDRSLGQRESLEASLAHKDILVEPNYLDGNVQYGETEITPDIQIQRLTAQLTAAYNRIAALEEQLLAQRIQ